MAQTALSSPDLSLIRGVQWIANLGMFITPRVAVATGTITAIPTKYPFVDLTISWAGSTSDVTIGQLVIVTDGTTVVSHAIVRKTVSGSTLYISETPLGSAGIATNVEIPIAIGNTVTVYSHHPLWSLNSRISNSAFYKRWDVAYSNQNEGAHAVGNVGTWQAAILEAGDTTARFTLPRNGVNTSFAIGSGAVSVEWFVPDGVTIASGYDEFDEVIEVDAVAGAHLVNCACYAGSDTHIAYLWLFVADGSSGVNLLETNAVTIEEDNDKRLGRVVKLTVYGSNLQNTLYKGAGFLMREWPSYAGEELTVGTSIDSFVGYIAELEFSHDGNIGKASVTIESPLVYAQRVGQASQSLTEVSEATKWTECEEAYSNPLGFAYYLMKWHVPTLLDFHDLDAESFGTPRRKYLECNNKSVTGNLSVIATYIAGNIGSASDGATVLKANPLYMSNAARNAIPTIWTLQEQDIKAPLDYFRRLYPAFSDTRGGGFYFGGGKAKANYAGKRWGQGSGATEMPNFTVTVSEGLAEIRAKVGHYAAEQNAEIQEIGLDLTLNQDVIDPAYMAWYGLSLSSDYDPYGAGFNVRLLATEIIRSWEVDSGGIKKRIRLIGQVESFGQAGEELPIGNVKGISQGGWSYGQPAIFAPNLSNGVFGGSQSVSLIVAHNTTGKLALCMNYYTANPEWVDLGASVDNEAVNDFCFDYGSDYFANGRDASQALGLFALTIDGTTAHIWYFADILRSPSALSIKTINLNDNSVTTNGRLECSKTYPLLVVAAFKDRTGTVISRSTDGGATFGSLTQVGNTITDSEDNDNAFLGMALDGQRQLISAPNATPVYGTYLATTAAGAFSKLASSQDSPYPQPMIAITPNGTSAYVTSLDVDARRNNFDGTDYWPYDATPSAPYPIWTNFIESADWTYNGISAGGLTGNAPKWTGTNPQGTGVGVDRAGMDFYPSVYPTNSTFYGFSCDVYFTLSAGSQTMRIGGIGLANEEIISKDTWTRVYFTAETFPLTAPSLNINFHPTTAVTGTMTVWVDNVTVYVGNGAKLWKVAAFPTAPVWSNVSPTTANAPERPHDFAIDLADTTILNTVTSLGTDWYKSLNSGSSWSSVATNTPYRALYTRGDRVLAAGLDSIVLSLNNASTFGDLEGDLDNVWDGIGTIKKVLAL